MRVIAGKAKGHSIKAPKGMSTRPTSDKVREAIFSTIASKVSGAQVLDLFAGSGALGIESLSRGAEHSVFVDNSAASLTAIRGNLVSVGLESRAAVIKKDVFRYVSSYKEAAFDLIFLDPPYKIGVNEILGVIKSCLGLLSTEGLIVVEHTKKIRLEDHISIGKIKAYGQTAVTYIGRD
ncbi:MAG TPA: 16S rRNA (guanine(966)-N(2))-methyltransferase RsmD [Actinobacteria bacterium]|nr:16S rRNA (guanine(966)-N(2))-methyltransferase RsmD [Actinomycetota bacterium]